MDILDDASLLQICKNYNFTDLFYLASTHGNIFSMVMGIKDGIIINFADLFFKEKRKIKIEYFVYALNAFSGITTELHIDLAMFENFGDGHHPNEQVFLKAMSKVQFPKLHKIAFANFTFNPVITNYNFMRKITSFSIHGNIKLQINELALVKYLANAICLKNIGFEYIIGLTGICFLSLVPETIKFLRLRNISFNEESFLLSALYAQRETLIDFEYSVNPDETGYDFPYLFSDSVARTLARFNHKLRTFHFYMNKDSINTIASVLSQFPQLQNLSLNYDPSCDISRVLQILPSIYTLQRLSITENIKPSNDNLYYQNHFAIEDTLIKCKNLIWLRLDIEALLASALLSIKMGLKCTHILCAVKKTEKSTIYSSLPFYCNH